MSDLKERLRAVAQKVLPSKVYQQIAAERSRQWQKKILRDSGRQQQVQEYVRENGTVVKAGPFAGMIYPESSALNRWSIPKLTGSYESELHPFLEQFRQRSYDCAIDVGSAEGYYACGLALMLGTPVYAYDPEPDEKAASVEIARTNKVEHLVKMDNLFTVEDMQKFAGRRVLMVCDCEGFEGVLFTPETLEFTRHWDLLIELHAPVDQTVIDLPWPHRTTVFTAPIKSGMDDEFRVQNQRFLICDSEGIVSGPASHA